MNLGFRGDKMSRKEIHDKRWIIHSVMSLGLILIVMAVSSLNVALPTLVRELGATATELQWIVDSYALVFAGLLLFAGALGDRFSRRSAFIFGLITVAVSSGLSAFADTPNELIVYRGIMGIGAAFTMPATLSIINNVFSKPEERTRAVALWAGFAGAGGSIGPVVSGLLLDSYWWGSIFLINIPVALIGILGAYLIVPDSKDPESEKLDFVGALLSIVGLGVLLFGIIEGPNYGWLVPETLGAIIGGFAVLVAFVWWELRTKHPMLPMNFFKSRSFSTGALSITLTFFAMFGMFFVLVQYMQFVLGYSPLRAAVATLPMTFMLIFVSAIVPRIIPRIGIRMTVVSGLLLAALGFVVLSALQVDSSYWLIFGGVSVIGAGMALAMPPATDALIGSVPERKAGVGSAMNDATREVGGALGIAILGSVMASGYRDGIADTIKEFPSELAELADQSIGGAQAVALELGEAGMPLLDQANQSFTDGLVTTMQVGAAFLIMSALVVSRWMPNKIDKIKG